jgi:hypothetical protein
LSPIASVSVVVLAQASILSLRAESKSMQSAGIAGLDPLAADESCAGTDAADSLDGLAGAAGAGAAAPAEAFGFPRHATTTTTRARATEATSAATHLIREVRFWKRRRVMVLPRANDPRPPVPTGGEVDDPGILDRHDWPTHTLVPPNVLRLSGARKRVRCSRGLGG